MRNSMLVIGASLALLLGLGVQAVASPERDDPAASPSGQSTAVRAGEQPNIVFVLLDDYSSELLQYMDGYQALAAEGVSFSNFVTSNPLCCPSRASILTGKYPHNTGVLNNQWPAGGLSAFLLTEQEESTVATSLQEAGYRTGYLGKYLNGYKPAGGGGAPGEPVHPPEYVPPGWDEWLATGAAYQHFQYNLVSSVDGDAEIVSYDGDAEDNYITDVFADRAEEFIEDNAAEPFFLMVNPFAVHGRAGNLPDPEGADGPQFPPAPRDRPASDNRPDGWDAPEFPGGDCGDPVGGGCDDVAYPDPSWGTSFNAIPENAPKWYATEDVEPLSAAVLRRLESRHVERVQMSQAADDLLDDVRAKLDAAGVLDDTYIVVTGDNGFHLGQHALGSGKSTPYTSDVVMPLVVVPPAGLAQPVVADPVVQNIDFLPTFLDLAGLPTPEAVDGWSFAAAIDGSTAQEPRRHGALVEYYDPNDAKGTGSKGDPDAVKGPDAAPPGFHALRTQDYLYVDYSTLDSTKPKRQLAEFYDLTTDPDEMHNAFQDLTRRQKRELNAALVEYDACAGAACRTAGSDAPSIGLPLR